MKKASYIIFRLLKKKKNNEINSDKIMLFYSFFSIMQFVMYNNFIILYLYLFFNY